MTELNIEDVHVYHLIGQQTLPLVDKPSRLSLLSSPSLTLTIGDSLAWALGPKAIFGTQSGNPRGYFLKPDLDDEASGWIKIELPASAVTDGSRTKLDDLLVSHGLLNSGPTSGDDLAKTLRDKAAQLGAQIDSSLNSLKSDPKTSTPASFSSSTHSAFDAIASGSSTAASFVTSAAQAAYSISTAAGSAIGSAVGLKGEPTPEGDKSEIRKDVESAFSETKRNVVDAGNGIADATSQLYAKSTSAAHEAITHTQGDEAGHLSSKAGETAANTGSIAKDAFLGMSVVEHGIRAGSGALRKE